MDEQPGFERTPLSSPVKGRDEGLAEPVSRSKEDMALQPPWEWGSEVLGPAESHMSWPGLQAEQEPGRLAACQYQKLEPWLLEMGLEGTRRAQDTPVWVRTSPQPHGTISLSQSWSLVTLFPLQLIVLAMAQTPSRQSQPRNTGCHPPSSQLAQGSPGKGTQLTWWT